MLNSFFFLLCVLSFGHSSSIACFPKFHDFSMRASPLAFACTLSLKSLKVILQISIWARSISVLNRHQNTHSTLQQHSSFFLPETPQSISFLLFLSAKNSQANWCLGHLSSLSLDTMRYAWIWVYVQVEQFSFIELKNNINVTGVSFLLIFLLPPCGQLKIISTTGTW